MIFLNDVFAPLPDFFERFCEDRSKREVRPQSHFIPGRQEIRDEPIERVKVHVILLLVGLGILSRIRPHSVGVRKRIVRRIPGALDKPAEEAFFTLPRVGREEGSRK